MEKCSISFMWFRFGHLDASMMSKKCVCVWGGLQFRLSSPRTHWHQDPHTTLNVLNQLLCTLQTDRFGWVCLPLNYLRWNYILKGFYFVDLTVFFPFVIICSRQHVRVLLRGNIIYLFFALIWREKLHCSSNNTCDICMEILLLLC